MTEQVDDLENRGRRCNVRIIGLPEDTEGSNPVRFFEKWIPDYLQVDTKAGKLKLERAHRSLAPKPAQGGRPRPVIIRFHNFQDKQRVMTAATKLFTLNSKQTSSSRDADAPKISFFNDYSAAVVQKRRAFNEVKTRLRELQMEYALLYPATLSVKVGRARKKFVSPEEDGYSKPLPVEVALQILANKGPRVQEIIQLLDWQVEPDYYFMVLERPMPCQSLEYCPLEYVTTGKYHGEPATVWSLGILLFVLVCADFPKRRDLRKINEYQLMTAVQWKLMERTINLSSNTRDLNLLLIGKTGSGVSASGNTVLGLSVFQSGRSLTSITDRCQKHTAEVANRRVTVIDTPNFFNSNDIDLSVELKRGLNMCSPGINAILLVLPLHTFTQQDADIMFFFKKMFGEKAMKHTFVLFTHGDELQNESPEQLIRENTELSRLTEVCGGRFHLLNNKDLNNREQVTKLLMKIERMVSENENSCYTLQMFKDHKMTAKIATGTWVLLKNKDMPQQIGGVDCGVFMLMYALHLTLGAPFDFTSELTVIKDMAEAVKWIYSNKHLLRGPVEEPLFLKMNEEDKEKALNNLLEQTNSSRVPFTFNFVFRDDMELFLQECRDKMGLRVNCSVNTF
ncbi:GTPase IMAP family member 7-like protein [Labeo rohita]|uniref:GTPase IMAP family member 8 n=1 Tax=Labeo rohita TaxID=84645 RepID=A0A498M3X9_LABRO|nr:GTPase IMAP family member 7-like protein [Labeo rohita]